MVAIQTRTLAQLPVATTLNANDLLVISQSGITKSSTIGLLDARYQTSLTVDTIAGLKALSVSLFTTGLGVFVKGYYAIGDGGEGLFHYDSTSSATANNGTIVQPTTGSGRWIRYTEGAPYSILWFGAKSDFTFDSTSYIQSCLTTAANDNQDVFSPVANLGIGSAVTWAGTGKIVGPQNSIWKKMSTTGAFTVLTVTGVFGSVVGITINGNKANTTYLYNYACLDLSANYSFASGVKIIDASSMGYRIINNSLYCKISDCYVITSGDMGIFVNSGSNFAKVSSNYIYDFGTKDTAGGTSGITTHAIGTTYHDNFVSLPTNSYAQDHLCLEAYLANKTAFIGNILDATYATFCLSATGQGNSATGNICIGGYSYGLELVDVGAVCSSNFVVDTIGTGISINLNTGVSPNTGDFINCIGNTVYNSSWTGTTGISVDGTGALAESLIVSMNTVSGFALPFNMKLNASIQADNNNFAVKTGISTYGMSGVFSSGDIKNNICTLVSGAGANVLAAFNFGAGTAGVDFSGNRVRGLNNISIGVLIGAGVSNSKFHDNYLAGCDVNSITDNANDDTNSVHDNEYYDTTDSLGANTVFYGNFLNGTTKSYTMGIPIRLANYTTSSANLPTPAQAGKGAFLFFTNPSINKPAVSDGGNNWMTWAALVTVA